MRRQSMHRQLHHKWPPLQNWWGGGAGYTHSPGNTHSNTLLTVCVNRTRAVWQVGGRDTTRVRGQQADIRFDWKVKQVRGGGGGRGMGKPRPCDVRALGMTGWLHYVSETFIESSLKKTKWDFTVLFWIWWKSWDKLDKHVGIIKLREAAAECKNNLIFNSILLLVQIRAEFLDWRYTFTVNNLLLRIRFWKRLHISFKFKNQWTVRF